MMNPAHDPNDFGQKPTNTILPRTNKAGARKFVRSNPNLDAENQFPFKGKYIGPGGVGGGGGGAVGGSGGGVHPGGQVQTPD